jgi:DNA-binding transcriptional ArsR family regulator
MSDDEQLLTFFKALADATRLKIVGLLAQKSFSVEELATLLALRPSTVSHHLGMLADAGLVSGHSESYYNVYQLENKVLEDMSRHLLARDTLPLAVAEVDINAYDRRVLSDFMLPDGSLKSVPAQRKKRRPSYGTSSRRSSLRCAITNSRLTKSWCVFITTLPPCAGN